MIMIVLEFYANFLPKIGGVQIHIRDLCKCLQGRGHKVYVLTFLMRGLKFKFIDGIPVYNILIPHILYRFRYPFVLLYGLLLYFLIKRLKIDVVHAHDYLPGLTAAFAGMLSGKRVFITFHLPIQYTSGKPLPGTKHIEAIIRSFLLRYVSKIICVCKYTFNEALKMGIPTYKMMVIYNWVPLNVLELAKKMNFKPSFSDIAETVGNERIIVSVGALERRKGFDILIKVIKLLRDEGLNVTLFIIGEGKERENLIKMAERYLVKDKVLFLGKVSDEEKIKRILMADIFVISSKVEGLPLTLLEAMVLGKAIIAPSAGGIPEVIKNGYNGILINIRDSLIIKSLKTLIHNEELRRRLGINAYHTVYEDFAYENCIKTVKTLEELVE
ncbi:MAG: glycosyltransferase family 4 protein [Candidatus Methanomethylicia archaeon]